MLKRVTPALAVAALVFWPPLRARALASASGRFATRRRSSGISRSRRTTGTACSSTPRASPASTTRPSAEWGIHYVNGDLIGDPAENPRKPEALVYQPVKRHLRLVAVEYVVFQDAWKAVHPNRKPKLFGHKFELLGADNRYGLPPFYELHAWIWKHNPRGMFDDWNPRVVCPG